MPTPPPAPHPLLALTLATSPVPRGHVRVVVDVDRRTTYQDFQDLAAAQAYAQDVRTEGDDPAHTLVLLFDAAGARLG